MDSQEDKPRPIPSSWPYDFDELRRATASLKWLGSRVGTVNPRPTGWPNGLIQMVKKLLSRLLTWYTAPLVEVNAAVSQSFEEVVRILESIAVTPDRLSASMLALEGRLAQSEKRIGAMAGAIEEQLDLLRAQIQALADLQKAAHSEALAGDMEIHLANHSDGRSSVYVDSSVANGRTAYVIGLFGTGRHYVNELIVRNIGDRAKYFRDTLRLHPGPTPMIYSGHATIKHVSRGQYSPEVMRRILEAAGAGFADVVFIYRHPFDSLLTNWVWWRTRIQGKQCVAGISEAYKDTDALCADMQQNFPEFLCFAEGDPAFFAEAPGPPFLSFPEFVEETGLHLQSATLALRLEDFAIDPLKEFSKLAEVMSVDLDLSRLSVAPPITKPNNYLAVKEKVPQFRDFIDGLDTETKRRIEKIGYRV